MPINPLKTAAMIMIATIRSVLLARVWRISSWPAQVPTPAISSPDAIATNAAIRMTTGSPKPARVSCIVSMPAKYSASDVQTAIATAGTRFHANNTIAAAMIDSVMTICIIPCAYSRFSFPIGDHLNRLSPPFQFARPRPRCAFE